jgi:hypothetical protein
VHRDGREWVRSESCQVNPLGHCVPRKMEEEMDTLTTFEPIGRDTG